MTGDFKCCIFNDYLVCIRIIPLKLRYVAAVTFIDEFNMLIVGGIDGVSVIKLEMHY